MTSKQYLKRKNKIVERVTGFTLVPKKQIKKHPFAELDTLDSYISRPGEILTADICTYCVLYLRNNCKDCPMHKAGNDCQDIDRSTWKLANRVWIEKAQKTDWQELEDLANQYNDEKGVKQ